MDSTLVECLKTFVGHVHPDMCPSSCVDLEPIPSESGYYINGYDEGAISIVDLYQCLNANGCDVGEQMCGMIKTAIEEFLLLFSRRLTADKTKSFYPCQANIGSSKKSTGPWMVNDDFVYLKIGSNCAVNGLTLKISHIELQLQNQHADPYELLLCKDGQVIEPITETSRTGNKSFFKPSWTLHLQGQKGSCDYYIVYDRKGAYPWNHKVHCNCGNTLPKWMQYVSAKSGTAVDKDSIETPREDYSAGMCITSTLQCDPLAFLCTLDPNCEYGKFVAHAIQLILRRLAANFINRNAGITPQRIISAKEYGDRAIWYQNNLENVLGWIVQEYHDVFSGCFVCTDQPYYQVTEIIR